MSSSKNLTFRQVFICLRPPPLLGFCLGWSNNFVGSESCQIQSVKLLLYVYGLQQDSAPPTPSSHFLSVCALTQRRGEGS